MFGFLVLCPTTSRVTMVLGLEDLSWQESSSGLRFFVVRVLAFILWMVGVLALIFLTSL